LIAAAAQVGGGTTPDQVPNSTSFTQVDDQGPVVGDIERRSLAPSSRWNARRTLWVQQKMIELHARSCCGVGGSVGEHAPTGDEPEQTAGHVEVAEQEARCRQLTQGPLGPVQLFHVPSGHE